MTKLSGDKIGTELVSKTLGLASNNVSVLYRSSLVNWDSYWKPIKGSRPQGIEKTMGWHIPSEQAYNAYSIRNQMWTKIQFQSTDPCRLGDFRSYDHSQVQPHINYISILEGKIEAGKSFHLSASWGVTDYAEKVIPRNMELFQNCYFCVLLYRPSPAEVNNGLKLIVGNHRKVNQDIGYLYTVSESENPFKADDEYLILPLICERDLASMQIGALDGKVWVLNDKYGKAYLEGKLGPAARETLYSFLDNYSPTGSYGFSIQGRVKSTYTSSSDTKTLSNFMIMWQYWDATVEATGSKNPLSSPNHANIRGRGGYPIVIGPNTIISFNAGISWNTVPPVPGAKSVKVWTYEPSNEDLKSSELWFNLIL